MQHALFSAVLLAGEPEIAARANHFVGQREPNVQLPTSLHLIPSSTAP